MLRPYPAEFSRFQTRPNDSTIGTFPLVYVIVDLILFVREGLAIISVKRKVRKRNLNFIFCASLI